MKVFWQMVSILLLGNIISACSMSQFSSIGLGSGEPQKLCVKDNGELYQCAPNDEQSNSMENTGVNEVALARASEKKNSTSAPRLFEPEINFQSLGEYTEQMVYILFDKISLKNIEKTIAVPPFISTTMLQTAEQNLSVELAELFVTDLQNIGLPVAEFVSSYADAEDEIDYLVTADKAQGNEHIGYVLKGTIRDSKQGLVVFAKIIDIKKKTVIASTSKLLPSYLITIQNDVPTTAEAMP